MPKFNTTQLVAFIKAHAITNYNKGWDVVVETMEDADIAETLGNASSHKAAIAAFAGIVGAFNEQRDMHRNEAILGGAEPTKGEIDSGKVAGLLGTPTLQDVLNGLTDFEKAVIVAHLDAGIDCNGADSLDAMRADNMTWSDVAETSKRTDLTKKQVNGVLSSLSLKGLLVTDCDPVNGEGAVQQVLSDEGIVVAFELLADGVEAKAKQTAPKQKAAPKPAPAPKKARVLDDRIITQPAQDQKHVKAVTQGSKRHLLIQALEKGATIDDLMAATGWGKDTVTSALRWDVSQAGLGCERKGGKYYLMLPKGFTKPAIVEKGQARVDALGAAK